MSENALNRKGELGRYSSRPNQKLTRQCKRASGFYTPGSLLEFVHLFCELNNSQPSKIC